MKKMMLVVAITVFGWAGWWLGEGYGIWPAFGLSTVGSCIGAYIWWRIDRDYLD